MATYCTVQDVRSALTPGAVADDENQTGTNLPDWQIEDAILEAEGTVNSFIATRYTITPVEVEESNHAEPPVLITVTVAPSPLRGWTRDVAAYLCALTFRRNKDLTEDDPIRLRFNMVMGFLTAVRDRGMNIPLPPAIGDEDDQGVHVENLYTGKLFGPEDFGLGIEGHVSPQILWPGRF